MKKLILVLALLALICPFMGMKLYLTNTSSSGQTQSDPNASLGGYRSTTELSATSMKNLFDDVSVVEALLGDTEYRMIDVYNDGTGTAYGVQLYMQTATSSSSTELNFGYSATNQPHADSWNGEALSNESTAPASPSMSFSNYTKTSPLSLGTIPASQSKRVCVRRTVTAGAPWTAHDLGRFGVRWGVAAPAGLTCTNGSGDSAIYSHTGHTDATTPFSDVRWKGIPFTLAADTRITSINLYLNNQHGHALNTIVRVETLSSSVPSGTLADENATKTLSIPCEGANNYEFVFATPFTLSAGTYVVVMKGEGTENDTNTFTDSEAGTFYWTTDSGANWTAGDGLNGYLVVEGCQ